MYAIYCFEVSCTSPCRSNLLGGRGFCERYPKRDYLSRPPAYLTQEQREVLKGHIPREVHGYADCSTASTMDLTVGSTYDDRTRDRHCGEFDKTVAHPRHLHGDINFEGRGVLPWLFDSLETSKHMFFGLTSDEKEHVVFLSTCEVVSLQMKQQISRHRNKASPTVSFSQPVTSAALPVSPNVYLPHCMPRSSCFLLCSRLRLVSYFRPTCGSACICVICFM